MERKVSLAQSAGFCFGAKRAVEMVYAEAEKKTGVCTLGPIVHNESVVSDLESKGVKVIDSLDQLQGGTVVIRSHGVSKATNDCLLEKGCEVIDATCPFVKKIHNTVSKYSQEGREIVIIGTESHPEVQGIIGWTLHGATVVENRQEAENLSINLEKPLCVVAQTTYNYKKFKELVEIISEKGYDIIAVNTICNATEERQKEALTLAAHSDAMVVIGGKSSSNSQKLFEICKNECENTFFIQTVEDISPEELTSFHSLGITAGASTPNNIIQEVLSACRR